MILGIILCVFSNTVSLIASLQLTKKIRTTDPALNILLFVLIRLCLISGTVILFASFGFLNALYLGIFAAVVAVAICIRTGLPFQRPPKLACALRLHPLLIIATLAVALRLLMQVWFFAPYNTDALSYHLPKVAEWIRAGQFTQEMGIDTHVTFPAGFEVLETWWVVFFRHDALIEMAGIEFLLLAFVSVYTLGKRVGFRDEWSYFAAICTIMSPGIQMGATSCLNDVPVMAVFLAAVTLVIARVPLQLIVLATFFGIGIKPTFAYALPGLLLLWLFVLNKQEESVPSKRTVSLLAVLGIAIGAFWYFRNTVWYGNPIHPVTSAGLVGDEVLKIQFGPSASSFSRNLFSLINDRIYDRAGPYSALLINLSGWGSVPFACGLVSLVFACKGDKNFRYLTWCFGLSLMSVLLLVNHDRWFGRFLLFFPALLCLSTTWLAQRHKAVLFIAVPGLVMQFLLTFYPSDLPSEALAHMLKLPWRERSMSAWLDTMESDKTVAYYVNEPIHNRGEAYLLYGPDFSRKVVYLRSRSAHAFVEEMDQARASLVYFSRDSHFEGSIIAECLELGLLHEWGGRFYVRPGSNP